jgi:hypothetical protein
MAMSICEKTTTLIFLDLELVHHFIDGTDIGSSATVTVSGYFATDGPSASQADKSDRNFYFHCCDRSGIVS